MKTKHIIYMVSALALAFVSCHQDEFRGTPGDGTMSFSVLSPNALGRVADDTFEAGDEIGLYVTDYVDAETPAPLQISGNRANNEVLVCDGASWATERPVYWGEGKSDVYAYYPYMEIEDIDEQPFSVAPDQSIEGAYEASDFLWAKAEGAAQSDGAISLNMKHQMSRLVVKIMAGEEYVGSLPADATVHLHSTITDARISLANGSVVKDPYGGAKSILMRKLGLRTFAEGEAVVFEAIVVPQMLETSVPLLEINSKSVSYLLEDMFNFKPGVSYTYTAVLNISTTAIKIDIGCSTDDWNNMGSGDGTGDGGSTGDGEDDGIDLSTYTDLSANGTANCYLVKAAGNYKFKAVQGNSNWSVGNVKKTEVLWESFGTDVMPNVGDLVASVGYKNGYVYFSTPETFKNGNASIAVRNSKGVILWSWHIWCAAEGWNDHVYPNNAGTMMDRNLGATSATPGDIGAFGLLYQWGRKDPFMGSCSLTEAKNVSSTGNWIIVNGEQTMSYSEETPMSYITCKTYKSWCSEASIIVDHWNDYAKTVHDPCPAGYRVPQESFWQVAVDGTTLLDFAESGLTWTLKNDTIAWYPYTWYIDEYGALHNRNAYGKCSFYWSSTVNAGSYYSSHLLCIKAAKVELGGYYHAGMSVRCVRE